MELTGEEEELYKRVKGCVETSATLFGRDRAGQGSRRTHEGERKRRKDKGRREKRTDKELEFRNLALGSGLGCLGWQPGTDSRGPD